MIWTTKEGQRINIRNMTDSHLRNAARWLREKADTEESAYFSVGSWLSGEEATYAWESAMDAVMEKAAVMREAADRMDAELQRREAAQAVASKRRAG